MEQEGKAWKCTSFGQGRTWGRCKETHPWAQGEHTENCWNERKPNYGFTEKPEFLKNSFVLVTAGISKISLLQFAEKSEFIKEGKPKAVAPHPPQAVPKKQIFVSNSPGAAASQDPTGNGPE